MCETVEPTCEEPGYTVYECECGEHYTDDFVDPLGHEWDEGVVTTEPTYEAEGEMTYTCLRCEAVKTGIIEKLSQQEEKTEYTEEEQSEPENDGIAAVGSEHDDPAETSNSISFIEHSWNGSRIILTSKSEYATKITYSNADWFDLGSDQYIESWYYIDDTVEMGDNTAIRINNNVKLILCDGSKLTVKRGIYIKNGCSLTIYGQSGNTGKLIVSQKSSGNPAIGGREDSIGGSLYIHGGNIEANGNTNAAGICGGNHKSGFNGITIYGGNVSAQGGSSGAGIGSGQQNSDSNCGVIRIYGGYVEARGGYQGAGIGGGEDRYGGNIEIYDGTVRGYGGYNGAGIGAGIGGKNNGTYIRIYGGDVYAVGDDQAAGIGGGNNSNIGSNTGNDSGNNAGNNDSGNDSGSNTGNDSSNEEDPGNSQSEEGIVILENGDILLPEVP